MAMYSLVGEYAMSNNLTMHRQNIRNVIYIMDIKVQIHVPPKLCRRFALYP